MHRSFLVALAVAMLFGCVGQSMAADGNLNKSMLTDMGLSSVQVMSDVQGEEIRGKGFARAFGIGFASVHGAGTVNGYAAAGRYRASGGNISDAGNNWRSAWAGGASWARAR